MISNNFTIFIIILFLWLFVEIFRKTNTKKIAFLFLIYDGINNEDLWNDFFKKADKNKYNIYIHYKTKKPLKYFEEYKIKNCIDTKYADKSLIHAQNLLYKTAYEDDSSNYKFVLVSGACIPVKSFDYVYNFLTENNKSYITTSSNNERFPNCNPLLKYNIPDKYITKGHQWTILNRNLVSKLAYEDKNVIDVLFQNIYAPEEIYYPTFVKIHGLEKEIVFTNDTEEFKQTTYTYWYKEKGVLHNFDRITVDMYNKLANSSCLFARKFNKDCKVV